MFWSSAVKIRCKNARFNLLHSWLISGEINPTALLRTCWFSRIEAKRWNGSTVQPLTCAAFIVGGVQGHRGCTWGYEWNSAGSRHAPDMSLCSWRPLRSSHCPVMTVWLALWISCERCNRCRVRSCGVGERSEVGAPAGRHWWNCAFISLSDPDLSAGHQEKRPDWWGWEPVTSLCWIYWNLLQQKEVFYFFTHMRILQLPKLMD